MSQIKYKKRKIKRQCVAKNTGIQMQEEDDDKQMTALVILIR